MMRPRSAVSIAELLVVMSACSIILTMSAALIHQAMRTQSDARAFYDAERSALRLARQFRHDVHNATAASADGGDRGESVLLKLQLQDGRTVEYGHSAGKVLRVLSQQGRAAGYEEFAFSSPIELDIGQAESPLRITLTITTRRDSAQGAKAMSGDMLVEATLKRAPNQEVTP